MLATRMKQAAAGSGAASYSDNVLALSPIGFWPLNETSGTNADNLGSVGADGDGTYSGPTLDAVASPITGDNAPSFDKVNDWVDAIGANMLAAFDGAEGSLGGWVKVTNAADWGTTPMRFFNCRVNGSNRVFIRHSATANEVDFTYVAGGTTEQILDTSLAADTGWHHFMITWSASNDRVLAYIDGAQVGTTQTALGAWSGALVSNRIGAAFDNSQDFAGSLSHWVLFDYELTAAQVLTVGTAV